MNFTGMSVHLGINTKRPIVMLRLGVRYVIDIVKNICSLSRKATRGRINIKVGLFCSKEWSIFILIRLSIRHLSLFHLVTCDAHTR